MKTLSGRVSAWLHARWAEPESRAAAAAAVTALIAFAVHKLTAATLALDEFGAAVMFALPAPLATEVLQAVAADTAAPAADAAGNTPPQS